MENEIAAITEQPRRLDDGLYRLRCADVARENQIDLARVEAVDTIMVARGISKNIFSVLRKI